MDWQCFPGWNKKISPQSIVPHLTFLLCCSSHPLYSDELFATQEPPYAEYKDSLFDTSSNLNESNNNNNNHSPDKVPLPPGEGESSPAPAKINPLQEMTPVDEMLQENPSSANPPSINTCDPAQLGALPISDWLNSIYIGNFLNQANSYILKNNDCFLYFDSSIFSLWVEPYGFYSHYRSPIKNENKIDFTLATLGVGLGSSFVLLEEWNLNLGTGYYHSHLDWKKCEGDTDINGFYFGPSIEYLFPQGSAGLTLFGMGNFYDGKRSIIGDKKIDYSGSSWDLAMRINAQYEVNLPKDFYIRPYLQADYLNVFEQEHHDKSQETGKRTIESQHSSFFHSQLTLQLGKILLCNKEGFLSANVNMGWVSIVPISSGTLKEKIEGSSENKADVKTETKNQMAIGFEIAGMRHNNVFIAIDYETVLGAQAPVQVGRMRIEWSW